MSLATEMQETNALLRDLAHQLQPVAEEAPSLDHLGRVSGALPGSSWSPLVAAMVGIQSGVLKSVPEAYGRVRRRDLATVVCRCRRGIVFNAAGFHTCECGRLFCFTGKRLLVQPLDA